VTGTLSGPGNTALAAGLTVSCSGFGVFDGTYLIEEGKHRLHRDRGYSTEIEVRQIPGGV